MNTTRAISIKPDDAIKYLDQFINAVDQFIAEESKDKTTLLTRYEITLRLIKSLHDDHPDYYNVVALLLHCNVYRIDKQDAVLKHMSDGVADLIQSFRQLKAYPDDKMVGLIDRLIGEYSYLYNIIAFFMFVNLHKIFPNNYMSAGYAKCAENIILSLCKSDDFPKQYLPWSHYIVAIISHVTDDAIRRLTFNKLDADLQLIDNARQAIFRIIEVIGYKNELIDQSAKILAGGLCYIYTLIDKKLITNNKHSTKSKSVKKSEDVRLKEFLNRNLFDNLHKVVSFQLSVIENKTTAQECLLQWFRLSQHNISFLNEYRLQKKTTTLENIIDNPYFFNFFDDVYTYNDKLIELFNTISSSHSFKDYFLIPNYPFGVNMVNALLTQTKVLIKVASQKIEALLHGLNIDQIASDYQHHLWDNLFIIMGAKLKLLQLKSDVYHNINLPQDLQMMIAYLNETETDIAEYNKTKLLLTKMDKVKESYLEKCNPDELIRMAEQEKVKRLNKLRDRQKPVVVKEILPDKEVQNKNKIDTVKSSSNEESISYHVYDSDSIIHVKLNKSIDLLANAISNNDLQEQAYQHYYISDFCCILSERTGRMGNLVIDEIIDYLEKAASHLSQVINIIQPFKHKNIKMNEIAEWAKVDLERVERLLNCWLQKQQRLKESLIMQRVHIKQAMGQKWYANKNEKSQAAKFYELTMKRVDRLNAIEKVLNDVKVMNNPPVTIVTQPAFFYPPFDINRPRCVSISSAESIKDNSVRSRSASI